MPIAFALLTSDPNLLACDLHRLADQVRLSSDERRRAVGVGSYAQDEVLLQRHAPEDAPRSVADLMPPHPSEAILFHAAKLPPSRPLESGTQPLRMRRWLFCMAGELEAFSRVKPELMAELPEHLRRHVVNDTPQELAFALFMKYLREVGRTDDRALEPALAARLIGRTARRLQTLAAEAGAARTSAFALFATNQTLLAACRSGGQSLYYRPLEGTDRCEVCGINPASPEEKVRAHKQRKVLAVATDLLKPAGWVELVDGAALATDIAGRVHVEPPNR